MNKGGDTNGNFYSGRSIYTGSAYHHEQNQASNKEFIAGEAGRC
jgi:hypothetical protein